MEVFLGFSWIIFVFSAHSVRVSIVYELGFFWERKKKKAEGAAWGMVCVKFSSHHYRSAAASTPWMDVGVRFYRTRTITADGSLIFCVLEFLSPKGGKLSLSPPRPPI